MDVTDDNKIGTELNDFIAEDSLLVMLKNISEAELKKIYSVAYDFYKAGKYQDAESLFQVLCILNHYDTRLFLALGACRQHQENYHLALETYSYASLMLPSDPRFPLHAGECLLHMKEFSTAKQAFICAELLAKTQPGYEALAEKAGVMLAAVTELAEAGNTRWH